MIVLGIDPGIAITGIGVVEQQGSRLHSLYCGVIRTDSKDCLADRLKILYTELTALLQHYKPARVGMEELFFNKNTKTALTVGQGRGVAMLAVAQANLPVLEFTPLQVKQSVVGYGRADKKQVIFMVQKLLNLQKAPTPDDAADALAIAICAVHSLHSVQYQLGRRSGL